MSNTEKTSFTSLLTQLDSRNKRIKDLERQLDNFFIVSQKYFKALKALREIKVIANRLEQTKIPFAAIAEQIKDKVAEVEDV